MNYKLQNQITALIITSALCLVSVSSWADFFYLKEEGSSKAIGPFQYSQGAKVIINNKSYVLLKKTSGKLSVKQKLQQTVIPEINFKDVGIQDAIEFLRKASIQFSPRMEDSKKGVNLILHPKARNNKSKVTFTTKSITLEEALKAVTQATGLTTRIEKNVIWVIPR